MAWTEPEEWEIGDVLTKDRLNEEIRDNLIALKNPPSANYEADETSDYTTSSTVMVDVDDTEGKFKHTITTNGGDVLVHFHGSFYGNSELRVQLDVEVDGTRVGGDDGIISGETDSRPSVRARTPISFTRLITGLSAGSHTFKLQWQVTTSVGRLIASGAGADEVHPQFWVREVS